MKALLIYPEYPATFWSYKYALTFINKKASLPPLGLLTVASLLPDEWEKKLIDLNVTKLKDSDIEWADCIFISGMIVQKKSAKEVVKRVKSFGKLIVAGGPLFSEVNEEFENIDCFVLNEGEITIPKFLKDFKKRTLKRIYSSEEKPDIKKTPVPLWSLINIKNYASMCIQISRGCPYSCDFCNIIIMNGRIPRYKSSEQVIEEFEAIYKTGWRGSLFIVDDNFIGNKLRVKDILKSIADWMHKKGKPFTLFTEASINLADDEEIMGLMLRANFNCVFVGIETPEEESLKLCGKVQNIGKNLIDKVKKIQRNGIEVQGGFILGFDTDTPEVFENMISFIQKSGIVTAMVGLLNAIPETEFYKKLQLEGRILAVPTGNNTDFSMNYIPKMNLSVLIQGYKKVLNTIFSPHNYYKRIKTYLEEYKELAVSTKRPIGLQLNAFLKSIWKIGFMDKSRFYFWKMFFWTIFRKPNLLPEAITQSIFGFHYRKVIISNPDFSDN